MKNEYMKATNADIKVGKTIYILGDDKQFHKHKIEEVYNPFDPYKGFCTKDGCRYGLYLSYVEIISQETTLSYKYCDGETLQTKVEEKTELDSMKEKYASGDYICIFNNYNITRDDWYKEGTPGWLPSNDYKLIHIKHKDILDAYLADSSVEINYPTDLPNKAKELSFVNNYNENVDYHLVKPKKKTISLAMFTCQWRYSGVWIDLKVYETIKDFKLMYADIDFINHHEIPNTRYEQEIDE